ncbi:hypothetical protein PENSTE_c002G03029 [Penicillium steckii]|uniref:Translationally-controlled tumor protein homolog n=1 Tax=Penicillium steckii TaxID=303698 RepID=A0A1V6TUZ1_9EURO|nr:hypothetical protein PENSTE_c002G03029 [Penicillium steckii]
MIIYTDIFTGDELISDSYNMKEVDGIVYEVDCNTIQIGGNNNSGIGVGSSTEGEGEEMATFDIVNSFNLNKVSFGEKSYLYEVRDYLRSVSNHLKRSSKSEDEMKEFQTRAKAFLNKVLDNFGDYSFYVGQSEQYEGMIALLSYREDGVTPFLTYWKHGLKETEV